VLWLAGEIELGGEDILARRLHLHMEVARAAGIEAGDDGLEYETSLGIAELVAAQAVALIVIMPVRIRVPEVEQRAWDRPAAPVEHKAGEGNQVALHSILDEVGALRRIGREIGAFGLGRGRIVAVAALRRRRQQGLVGRRAAQGKAGEDARNADAQQ